MTIQYVGVFVSTAGQGGGQESTVIATMSTFAHHGMIYVPLGFSQTSHILSDLNEVRGGSAWGAGTFAVSIAQSYNMICKQLSDPHQQAGDGSRQPSAKEIELAEIQGKSFFETVSKVSFT